MTRYFLDCEFIEDGITIDLISMGIVCEDGRELYLGNQECNFSKASDWVKDNVLIPMGFCYPHVVTPYAPRDVLLRPFDPPNFWKPKSIIRDEVAEFLGAKRVRDESGLSFVLKEGNSSPEIWGEWVAYDHIVLCQLFGTMIDLPKGFPMRCRDLVQLAEDNMGILADDLPPSLETDGNHNALLGARTVKMRYEFLQNYNHFKERFIRALKKVIKLSSRMLLVIKKILDKTDLTNKQVQNIKRAKMFRKSFNEAIKAEEKKNEVN